MCARKELKEFCPRDFFVLPVDAFLSTGNIVGGRDVTIWGKIGGRIWGLNLPHGDEI